MSKIVETPIDLTSFINEFDFVTERVELDLISGATRFISKPICEWADAIQVELENGASILIYKRSIETIRVTERAVPRKRENSVPGQKAAAS